MCAAGGRAPRPRPCDCAANAHRRDAPFHPGWPVFASPFTPLEVPIIAPSMPTVTKRMRIDPAAFTILRMRDAAEKGTDLLDYEIFARVIKAGSLSAAARELHSSPAMISKRLTRLEERLGVRGAEADCQGGNGECVFHDPRSVHA